MLSIVAWFVYIVLLWGHYHEGWRGRRVVWFNVAGAGILTLAYFGSRILQQFVAKLLKEFPTEHISTTADYHINHHGGHLSTYFFRFRNWNDDAKPLPFTPYGGNKVIMAKRVEKLLRKPDRLISTGAGRRNTVNIAASALSTIVGMRLYGDAGVAITGVLTFVVVFAGVLPKLSPRSYPEKVAYPSNFLLAPLQILMTLVWLPTPSPAC